MDIPIDENVLQSTGTRSSECKCSCGNLVRLNYPDFPQLKAKAELFDEIYRVYDNGGTDFEVAQNMRIILAQYERANKLTGSK